MVDLTNEHITDESSQDSRETGSPDIDVGSDGDMGNDADEGNNKPAKKSHSKAKFDKESDDQ